MNAIGVTRASKSFGLETVVSDFELLDDWEDKYRYVIELGRMLEPFPEAARTDANKVRGCASQVWLLTEVVPAGADGRCPVLTFRGDSDAHIVKGLIAILFEMLSGHTAEAILAADPMAEFAKLGLAEHLTPQRSNGLASLVARIKAEARLLE